MSLREQLGWNDFFEQQRRTAEELSPRGHDLLYSRVVEEQRGLYRVAGDIDGWAEVSGRFRHEAATAADFPAVGDWVGVEGGIIHLRLERRSTVSRAAAGRAVEEQVVAANVDIIFLVTALTAGSQSPAPGALSDTGLGRWCGPDRAAEQGRSLRRSGRRD